MNAKEYRKERDTARQAVATLAWELERCYEQIQKLCVTVDQQEVELDTWHGRYVSGQEHIEQLEEALKIMECRHNQERANAEHWQKTAERNYADYAAERNAHNLTKTDAAEWKAQAARERDNPYYKNLTKECDDLRTINAANQGPVWTKALNTFIHEDRLKLIDSNVELTRDIEQLRTDYSDILQVARVREGIIFRLNDTLTERKRELDVALNQKSSLQNRLECQIHNRREREKRIVELQTSHDHLLTKHNRLEDLFTKVSDECATAQRKVALIERAVRKWRRNGICSGGSSSVRDAYNQERVWWLWQQVRDGWTKS